ncbi:unnamed protein product [Moneuplotes crassus]|uniref:Uncharacterized protein n=1 Tax=Euplotes crassus TaxID=5936 RepID=A0AAD1UL91_EUPCR|nr:unnamed protein product [Moneuplotes crassus]
MKINAQIVIAYHWRKRRRMFQKRLEEMAKQARRKNSNKKKIKKPRQSVKWNMRGPSHTIKLKKQSSNIKSKALKKRKSLNSNTDLDTVKED